MNAGPAPPSDGPRSDVDLWRDEVLADPFPVYAELRELGAAVWLERHGVLALPRFTEVQTALSRWETFSSAAGVSVDPGANEAEPSSMIKSDPPAHTGFRRPLAGQLSPRRLARERAEIERSADSLLDRVLTRGRFDAVSELARPFSLSVVGDLLGLPEEEREHLPLLAVQAFNAYGPANERLASAPPALGRLFAHAAAMTAPGVLRAGSRGEELLALAEPEKNIIAYTLPGVETTANALASAVYLFARHPDQWTAVRRDLSLIPGGFHEVLRMHAPVHYFTRRTTTPTSIGGVEVPAGTRVLLMYGSANRDERRYPDADRFDVRRNPTDHLAYGRGVHHCVGMNLAKLEAGALVAALARRVERFELDGDPEWMINNTLHGLRTLPVTVIA